MSKLSRPPLIVWFQREAKQARFYKPESKSGYVKRYTAAEVTGQGEEGEIEEEEEVVWIDEQGIIWPPSSEVLYTRAVLDFLREHGLTNEEGDEVGENVQAIWAPFPHGGGVKEWPNGRPYANVGPAANFDGWDYHAFSTVAELAKFIDDKSAPVDVGAVVKGKQPLPPKPERRGKAGKLEFLPGEKVAIEAAAKKVGIEAKTLRDRIRSEKSTENIEQALTTPVPALTKRLLDKGIPLDELTGRISKANKPKFDKFAETLGVKPDWLTRVLHGKYTSEKIERLFSKE